MWLTKLHTRIPSLITLCIGIFLRMVPEISCLIFQNLTEKLIFKGSRPKSSSINVFLKFLQKERLRHSCSCVRILTEYLQSTHSGWFYLHQAFIFTVKTFSQNKFSPRFSNIVIRSVTLFLKIMNFFWNNKFSKYEQIFFGISTNVIRKYSNESCTLCVASMSQTATYMCLERVC